MSIIPSDYDRGYAKGVEDATPPGKAIPITGIHLVRLGGYVVVKAEIDGQWVEVIREWHDGSFSHIVEPLGMRRRQADAIVGATDYARQQ